MKLNLERIKNPAIGELTQYELSPAAASLTPVTAGHVHQYTFKLFLVN